MYVCMYICIIYHEITQIMKFPETGFEYSCINRELSSIP